MNKTEWKNEKGEIVHFIKIIDLLNKIANGEAPKQIKYKDSFYKWEQYQNNYWYYETGLAFYRGLSLNENVLNDEVEIIEEDKTIEELQFDSEEKYITTIEGTSNKMRNIDVTLATKINELVKEINKMKEK